MKSPFLFTLLAILASVSVVVAKPGPPAKGPVPHGAYHFKADKKFYRAAIRRDNKEIRAEQKAIKKHTQKRDRKLANGNARGAAKQQHYINLHKRELHHQKKEKHIHEKMLHGKKYKRGYRHHR